MGARPLTGGGRGPLAPPLRTAPVWRERIPDCRIGNAETAGAKRNADGRIVVRRECVCVCVSV